MEERTYLPYPEYTNLLSQITATLEPGGEQLDERKADSNFQTNRDERSLNGGFSMVSVPALGGHRLRPLLGARQLLHPLVHHGVRLHTHLLRGEGAGEAGHPEAASPRGGAARVAGREADELHAEHARHRGEEAARLRHGERRHHREPARANSHRHVRLRQRRQHLRGGSRRGEQHPHGGEGHAQG